MVRVLENDMQRAMVMAKSDVILPSDLPLMISAAGGPPGVERPAAAVTTDEKTSDLAAIARMLFQWARDNSKLKILPAVERELIIQALLETKGNQVQAAKLLGITRATLRKRVEKFQIKQELAIQ
jgi:two-component system nitrogen regulation response regulator GlnG